jgi:ferric-dicitrate binding protein FerR (iron transport regulator)
VTPETALQIIESHGGDPLRWPDADRAAVLALARRDALVGSALAEAQALDAMLADWAGAAVPARLDLAAITRSPQERPAGRRRWLTGGALAAAVAAAVIMVAPMRGPAPTPSSVPSATAMTEADSSDAEAFGQVFTPTADEEDLI